MSKYTKILEFFIENRIQLNTIQLNELKILCTNNIEELESLFEDTRLISQDLDGFAHKHNVDTTSRAMIPMRKVDLAYRKLKRGAISKDEYDSTVNEIRKEYKSILGNGNIKDLYNDFTNIESRKEFTKSVGQRQNKDYVPDFSDKIKFKTDKGKIQSADLSNLSDQEYAKLKRQIDIAQSTNDIREHKEAMRRINKLIGKDVSSSVGLTDKNKKITSVPDGEEIDMKTGYHTSKADKLTELKGNYRSTGRMLYPDRRIYVADPPMLKGGKSNIDKSSLYKADTENLKVKNDNEFDNSNIKSGYIETEKIKVDQIKKPGEKYKEDK